MAQLPKLQLVTHTWQVHAPKPRKRAFGRLGNHRSGKLRRVSATCLYCYPKGRRALLRIPSTVGRSVCLCWAKSKPKGPKGPGEHAGRPGSRGPCTCRTASCAPPVPITHIKSQPPFYRQYQHFSLQTFSVLFCRQFKPLHQHLHARMSQHNVSVHPHNMPARTDEPHRAFTHPYNLHYKSQPLCPRRQMALVPMKRAP